MKKHCNESLGFPIVTDRLNKFSTLKSQTPLKEVMVKCNVIDKRNIDSGYVLNVAISIA